MRSGDIRAFHSTDFQKIRIDLMNMRKTLDHFFYNADGLAPDIHNLIIKHLDDAQHGMAKFIMKLHTLELND